jgi:hypothetical protein
MLLQSLYIHSRFLVIKGKIKRKEKRKEKTKEEAKYL